MVGAGIMLALTAGAVNLYLKFQTIFLVSYNLENFRPLLLPRPRPPGLTGRSCHAGGRDHRPCSLRSSRLSRRLTYWVDAITDTVALVLIGMLLRLQYTNLFAVDIPRKLLTWFHFTLTVTLLIAALIIAIDLVANLVRLGRKRLAK